MYYWLFRGLVFGWLNLFCRVEVLAETEVPGGRGTGRLYLTLHWHRQNDSCIKMGSDESHFNVSSIEGQNHTDSVHRPQHFKREREKPKRNGTEVLLLTSLTPYREAKPSVAGVLNGVFYWAAVKGPSPPPLPPPNDQRGDSTTTTLAKRDEST